MGHSFGGHLGSEVSSPATSHASGMGWIEQDGEHDSSCRMWNYARDRGARKSSARPGGERSAQGGRYWNRARRFYAKDWKCGVNTKRKQPHRRGQRHRRSSSSTVSMCCAAGGCDVSARPRPQQRRYPSRSCSEVSSDIFAVTKNMPYPLKGLFAWISHRGSQRSGCPSSCCWACTIRHCRHAGRLPASLPMVPPPHRSGSSASTTAATIRGPRNPTSSTRPCVPSRRNLARTPLKLRRRWNAMAIHRNHVLVQPRPLTCRRSLTRLPRATLAQRSRAQSHLLDASCFALVPNRPRERQQEGSSVVQ